MKDKSAEYNVRDEHGTGPDVLIKGGSIIDGTGSQAYQADLIIKDDRILGIGNFPDIKAKTTLDAAGMTVVPGFIDIHSHHDLYLFDKDPAAKFESFVRQGITTCIVGNCGWGAAPCVPETRSMLIEQLKTVGISMQEINWTSIGEFLSVIEKLRLMFNVVCLAAHGPLRIAVMGDQCRFSNENELRRMKEWLREGMKSGCAGFSTGLMYYPGMFSHTDELIELSKVAGEFGRPYASHLRGYCTTLPYSLTEAITIAKQANVPLQISHLNALPMLGNMAAFAYYLINAIDGINRVIPMPAMPNATLAKAFKIIQEALDAGVDLGIDAVPNTLGNTTITALFPPWANKGGKDELLKRLKNPEYSARIAHDIRTIVPVWPHWEEGSWSDTRIKAIGWRAFKVLSVASSKNRAMLGKNFIEIGRMWGTDAMSAMFRLAIEEDAQVTVLFGIPNKPWLEKMSNKVLEHPLVSIGSDSILPEFGPPPPMAYGCFPRFLGHYCRDMRMISLEKAVYKMTGLPASRFKLKDRGTLKEGAFADVVVFDPLKVDEAFTDDGLPAFCKGIEHVITNGTPIVVAGKYRGALHPGKLLRM